MSLWRQITRGLRVLTSRRAADQDVTDELHHYLDEATAAFGERGLGPDEARRAARYMVGNPIAIHEQVRDYGWENVVGTAAADLRFAGRMLRKSPVFTIVVVLVIALGSGAVTTMFSALNALLLRPIPGVGNPDRLVEIQPVRPDGQILQQGSYLTYQSLRDRSQTLDAVAAWGRVSLTIAAGGEGASIGGNMVSGNFFESLGVRPALGRFFAPDETRTPLSHPVIVVSYAFWKSRLGSDPAAIGRTLLVNGTPFTLVGIAPEEFSGIYAVMRADAWVPLMMQPLLRPRSNLTNSSWLWLVGRLRSGSTIDAAQRELAALATAQAIEAGEPRGSAGYRSARVLPFTGLPGGEAGSLFGFISLLLGAATLVLLIAGVNVAAMLSARSVARRREFAVRAALGAGPTRLVRQLLTEILLLFSAGAIGGIVCAVIATAALEQIPLPVNVPLQLDLSPDFRVLAFAVGISLLTGLTFGLAPALQAARQDITSRLRDDSPGSGSKRIFMNRALIVGQLALSMILLVAAGLFMRALARGQQVNPGFDITDVTTAAFETESWGYDEARARAFYRSLRERVEGLPDVTAVSYTGRLPLTAGSSFEDIRVPGGIMSVHDGKVDVDYFAVLRIPLLEGRAFRSTDDRRSPPVAVVNETFARRGWPDGGAVGRTFQRNGQTVTIVGIARDAKYATLGESTPPFAYLPVAQVWQPSQALMVRSAAHSNQLAAAIQEAALSIEPAAPRPRVMTMGHATSIVLLPQRVAAMVTGVLGAVGLLLATIGLYGIMAYSANRRTREIGIRVALGAQRSNVLRLMVIEGMRLAIIGIVIGLLLAGAVTPLMKSFLFTVNPLDVRTFAGMSLLFLAVALVASYLPARRAAASDPLAVLRAD
jgi:predicted permease